MLLIMLLMLGGSLLLTGMVAKLVQSQVRVMTEQSFGKASFAFAEGALEDVAYRYIAGFDVSASESLTDGDLAATVTSVADIDGVTITSEGDLLGRTRTAETVLLLGAGASFAFGVQTGNGGFFLENSSSVNGNVYSNGPIEGHNQSSRNDVVGTVISAGPSGSLKYVHVHEDAYAHEIEKSTLDGDAYYQVIDLTSETTIGGYNGSSSPDQATSSFPIPDSTILTWAEYASTSDVWDAECASSSNDITISSDIDLGPVKIPCDVTFDGSPKITVQGVIWIAGNLTLKNGPEFHIDNAIGNKSVPIIVGDPDAPLTTGVVDMNNTGTWHGNGNRSYLLLISLNESFEQTGSGTAIDITNSAGGKLLVYTNHGEITMRNSVNLTMMTAYRIHLQQSSVVNYDNGIASTLFEVGPGGGYTIDSWREVE